MKQRNLFFLICHYRTAEDIDKIHIFKPQIKGNESRLLKQSLFLRKDDFQVNPDVLHKTDIRNSQAISKDAPDWTLRTMEWYGPEYFDPAAKAQRIKPKGRTDVFGNPPNEMPRKLKKNEKQFLSTPAVAA